MFIEFSLPYYLILGNGFYDFVAREDFLPNISSKKRKICFELTSRYHENQEVPLRESTIGVAPYNFVLENYRYNVMNTNIKILIECFNDEKDNIDNEYQVNRDEFIINIMQACLEFILFKYNESSEGRHAISPSVFDCSHIAFYYFYGNGIIIRSVVMPNINNTLTISDINFKNALKENIVVWKEFFNESRYANLCYDYKKSIIYSAISLESFVGDIISKNNLQNKGFVQDKKGNHLSIKKKIYKLIAHGFIRSTLLPDKISDLVDKVTFPRNDLMHGKVNDLMNLKNKSNISAVSLEQLYSDWKLI